MDFHLPHCVPLLLDFSCSLKRIGRRGLGRPGWGWRMVMRRRGVGKSEKSGLLCGGREITSNWDPLPDRVWYLLRGKKKLARRFQSSVIAFWWLQLLKYPENIAKFPPAPAPSLWNEHTFLFFVGSQQISSSLQPLQGKGPGEKIG